MLRRSLRSLVTASAFATLVSASGVASAEDTAEPTRPAAVERARIISFVAMSAGAAAMISGGAMYAVGSASTPDGCTLQSCDVRRSNGVIADSTVPCRDLRADGCVGSPYNVSRQTETARADAMKSAGLVTTAIGAAVAAGGFLLWLRTPSTSAHVVPAVGAGYGGAMLAGEF